MKAFALLALIFAAPHVAFAGQTIGSIINTATNLALFAVQIAVALALLFFMWSMFQLMTSLDSAEQLKKVRPRIIWGIIILFVILSLGALITVLDQTFFSSGSQLQQGFNMGGGQAPGGVFTPPQGGSGGVGSGSGGGGGFDGVIIPPDTGDDEMVIDPTQTRCWQERLGFSCPTVI